MRDREPGVYRICTACNQEYLLPLARVGNGIPDMVCNFLTCPLCGVRDDPWIKVVPVPALTPAEEDAVVREAVPENVRECSAGGECEDAHPLNRCVGCMCRDAARHALRARGGA